MQHGPVLAGPAFAQDAPKEMQINSANLQKVDAVVNDPENTLTLIIKDGKVFKNEL